MKKYFGYTILVKLPFQEDIFYMHIDIDEKIFWIQDFNLAAISVALICLVLYFKKIILSTFLSCIVLLNSILF